MTAIDLVKEKRVPHSPGVYIMKDAQGCIIYIGKAKDLFKRVGSYFVASRSSGDSWKTSRLVSKIADIDFMVTDNETEALLLESNLIKRYRPAFNIELKDQQRYTYLKITEESFPRLLVARRNRAGQFAGPKGKVYGPFVRGSSKFLTVGLLRKLFKIRVCVRLPKTPCLQYFIKNCDAPCIDPGVMEAYARNVRELREILEGKRNIEQFAQTLEREMREASDLGQYEQAKEIRDTLFRLNNLRVRQKMEKTSTKNADEEFIGILRDERRGTAHVMLLRRSRGVISDRKKFEFDLVADNSLDSFILQYYSSSPSIPHSIYASEAPESEKALCEALERLSDHKVRIIANDSRTGPEKKAILDLIMKNLSIYVDRGYSPSVSELKKVLDLSKAPEVIDCFDVSNLGMDIAVGACTRFVAGKPSKSGYRKFKIKTVSGQDDFAMVGELVARRYSREPFDALPDLVVIDGGKGQLAAAITALENLGIAVISHSTFRSNEMPAHAGEFPENSIECVSLAKQNEEIFVNGKSQPLRIPRSNEGLRLLQHIRDEAHRFGLAYNRQLRRIEKS